MNRCLECGKEFEKDAPMFLFPSGAEVCLRCFWKILYRRKRVRDKSER